MTAPEAGPPAAGKKLTVMLQLEPWLSEAGQLFDSRNGPVTVIEEIASGPGPFAVSLTLPRFLSRRLGSKTRG